jgi:uncharacterized membrane protein YbhN (UPF0104 family)
VTRQGDANKKAKKSWGKNLLNILFFVLVPIFLFLLIKNTDWQEVVEALHKLEWTTLGLCLLIAAFSYAVYGSYDLLGRWYTGHKLPAHKVVSVAAVCYAFTLNLSFWVGGFALRYRLYSRMGLETATITRIFSLSVLTNWLGYLILAGCIFSMKLLDLPPNWKIGETGLQIVGFGLLLVAATYLVACRFAKKRSWQFRDHKIELPEWRIAFTQAGLAMLNWSLMALLIFILLPDKVTYPTVMGILLISGIAGVITHIPAGLGVLEAIFVTLLQHQLSQGVVLAALIGYRLVYFLIPLGVAAIAYFVLEGRAKKTGKSSTNKSDDKSSAQVMEAS